jgi:hypothetical protein
VRPTCDPPACKQGGRHYAVDEDKAVAAGVPPIGLEIDGIGWVSDPPDWLLEGMAERRPSFNGPIFANLFDGDDDTYNLIWSRGRRQNSD